MSKGQIPTYVKSNILSVIDGGGRYKYPIELSENEDQYSGRKTYCALFRVPDDTAKLGFRRKDILLSEKPIRLISEFPDIQLVLLEKISKLGSTSIHMFDTDSGDQISITPSRGMAEVHYDPSAHDFYILPMATTNTPARGRLRHIYNAKTGEKSTIKSKIFDAMDKTGWTHFKTETPFVGCSLSQQDIDAQFIAYRNSIMNNPVVRAAIQNFMNRGIEMVNAIAEAAYQNLHGNKIIPENVGAEAIQSIVGDLSGALVSATFQKNINLQNPPAPAAPPPQKHCKRGRKAEKYSQMSDDALRRSLSRARLSSGGDLSQYPELITELTRRFDTFNPETYLFEKKFSAQHIAKKKEFWATLDDKRLRHILANHKLGKIPSYFEEFLKERFGDDYDAENKIINKTETKTDTNPTTGRPRKTKEEWLSHDEGYLCAALRQRRYKGGVTPELQAALIEKFGANYNAETQFRKGNNPRGGRPPKPLDQMTPKQLQDRFYNIRHFNKVHGTNIDTSKILEELRKTEKGLSGRRQYTKKPGVQHGKMPGKYPEMTLKQLTGRLYNVRVWENKLPPSERKGDDPELLKWIKIRKNEKKKPANAAAQQTPDQIIVTDVTSKPAPESAPTVSEPTTAPVAQESTPEMPSAAQIPDAQTTAKEPEPQLSRFEQTIENLKAQESENKSVGEIQPAAAQKKMQEIPVQVITYNELFTTVKIGNITIIKKREKVVVNELMSGKLLDIELPDSKNPNSINHDIYQSKDYHENRMIQKFEYGNLGAISKVTENSEKGEVYLKYHNRSAMIQLYEFKQSENKIFVIERFAENSK